MIESAGLEAGESDGMGQEQGCDGGSVGAIGGGGAILDLAVAGLVSVPLDCRTARTDRRRCDGRDHGSARVSEQYYGDGGHALVAAGVGGANVNVVGSDGEVESVQAIRPG